MAILEYKWHYCTIGDILPLLGVIGLMLGKTITFLKACKTPSGAIRTSSQGDGFQVSPGLVTTSPVTKAVGSYLNVLGWGDNRIKWHCFESSLCPWLTTHREVLIQWKSCQFCLMFSKNQLLDSLSLYYSSSCLISALVFISFFFFCIYWIWLGLFLFFQTPEVHHENVYCVFLWFFLILACRAISFSFKIAFHLPQRFWCVVLFPGMFPS